MNTHYDLSGSRAARDAGIAQVLDHTDEIYKLKYYAAWFSVLRSKQPFTNDDVLALVGPPPNHPNASGGLFHGCLAEAMKAGLVAVHGETQMSKRSSHARSTKVYIAK